MPGQEDHEQQSMRRRIDVLIALYERQVLSKNDLIDVYKAKKYEYKDCSRVANSDIDYIKANIPFVDVIEKKSNKSKKTIIYLIWDIEWDRCWKDTGVYTKLKDWRKSKSQLFDAVVSVLEELKAGTLLVGKGTTCYMIAKSIFNSTSPVNMICTANLLIVCEAIRRNVRQNIWVPKGTLNPKTAYLEGKAIEELGSQAVDASLTSFMGVKLDAIKDVIKFYGNNFEEAEDKHMNLNPHPGCKNIIIALGRERINKGGVDLVSEKDLDAARQYIVVTDIPERDPSNEKLESQWQVLDRLTAKSNVALRTAAPRSQ